MKAGKRQGQWAKEQGKTSGGNTSRVPEVLFVHQVKLLSGSNFHLCTSSRWNSGDRHLIVGHT